MTDDRHAIIDTTLCSIALAASGENLVGLAFELNGHYSAGATMGPVVDSAHDPLLRAAHTQLTEYLTGDRRDFDLPLATHGDAFSEQVWALLREIPYGETTTYGAIATALGNPRFAQRVGQVVGRNPIGIIIPCHRVIGADGTLTGFGGGLDRKRRLLDLEEPAERRAERLF